jgi:hypothetical protein
MPARAVDSGQCLITTFLCGESEALFGGFWDGKLTKCEHLGNPYCEVEVYLRKDKEGHKDSSQSRNSPAEMYSLIKDATSASMDEVAKSITNRKNIYPRKDLGDLFHISMHQYMNFLQTTPSPGHAVLSRYAGRVCGKRLVRESELQGLENALKYLEDLFLYLKAGILQCEKRQDRVIIKM